MENPSKCLVPQCPNTINNKSLGHFFITKNRRDSWAAALGMNPKKLSAIYFVCSEHFLSEQLAIFNGEICLRDPFAVPFVNLKGIRQRQIAVVPTRPIVNTVQSTPQPKGGTPNCLILVDPTAASKLTPITKEEAARAVVPSTNKVLCVLDPKKAVKNVGTSRPFQAKQVMNTQTTSGVLAQSPKIRPLKSIAPGINASSNIFINSEVQYQINATKTVPMLMVQPTKIMSNLDISSSLQQNRSLSPLIAKTEGSGKISFQTTRHLVKTTTENKKHIYNRRGFSILPEASDVPQQEICEKRNLPKSAIQLKCELRVYQRMVDRLKEVLKKMKLAVEKLKKHNAISNEVYYILMRAILYGPPKKYAKKHSKYAKSVTECALTVSRFSKRTLPFMKRLLDFHRDKVERNVFEPIVSLSC